MPVPPKPSVTPERWEQGRKEGAIERAEDELKKTEAELLAVYDDSDEEAGGSKRSQSLDKELADKWQALKRTAMQQFPEGSQILGLSPKNRLVAIAHCLGWGTKDIAKASGIATSTVYKWLNDRPDIKVFINEFNLRAGAKDIVKEKFSELEYKAVQFINSLLSDKDTTDAIQRLKLDASKWVFDRSRGKPNQPVEHQGEGLRKMLEVMQKVGQVSLSTEDEAEIFKN